MNSFPFEITDVVRILNLSLRRKKYSSWYLDCPFCGRKGKLNINLLKDAYRCNACSESGGMLKLYADLEGTTQSQACRACKDSL